ncbi:MAG TPA: neuraminidase-like domain-containing protein [Opitutaceae bacterium]|nr:neuraminidase-like domain-containing protein [Opitutaceae bacterium]
MNKITSPLALRAKGAAVVDLQDALKLGLDQKFILPKAAAAAAKLATGFARERAARTFGENTAKLVALFQVGQRLSPSGAVDKATADAFNSLLTTAGLLERIPAPSPAPNGGALDHHVEGRVGSKTRAGTGGLRVVIVDRGIGADVTLAEAKTDLHGAYRASFPATAARARGKTLLDLQARVFAGTTFLAASEVRYNAGPDETLHVLLDAAASAKLPPEHTVLTSTLAGQFQGRLGDLRENDVQQDITYLANKTGWDARAVALAALADQFSTRTAAAGATRAAPVSAEIFYALFRAGLPANEDTLFHTEPATLERSLQSAADQGVISKSAAGEIPAVVKAFEALSAQKMLAAPAVIGASSLKEMLAVSGLNATQQGKFAELYAANRSDLTAFWKAAGTAFGAPLAQRLQVDGKLGSLTVNNAALMEKVHATAGKKGLTDPLQLAQTGYHRAAAWSKLLNAKIPVPDEIPGDTAAAKRANYAAYLAAQVRMSYPTASVAQMVRSRELPLPGTTKTVSDKVAAFLDTHQGKFELGALPVQQYLARNKLTVDAETVKQVQRLQRVYQITPGDQALTGLMKRGVDSAYRVASYDRDTFVRSFAEDLGGTEQASLTYDKATQVHHVVLNLALGYLNARNGIPIGVHSPASVLDPTPAYTGDINATPSLETLFGSMDFCTCDHCRSILSPAAYLVDLLQFLQSDAGVWTDYANAWKADHGNAPYPFINQAAWQAFKDDWNANNSGPVPNTAISPFSVLVARRPDIQHLPLTCENTNTALPYIDVVNETLEYFIANNSQPFSLQNYKGHDSDGAETDDLLASPQFVMDSAYTILRQQHFPAPLPFHQPLEYLRRVFTKFEVPLPLAMERLRRTNALERGANPYGWRDILMEEIHCSRQEFGIFADSQNVPLWRMYGFPSGAGTSIVVAGLSNAVDFTRRLDLSYEELTSILKTRFINPDSDLIPKLERLGVSFAAMKALKDGTISNAAFDALLPTGLMAPDPAEYGGNIRNWVKNNANYARIMGLVVLTIPAAPWTRNKHYNAGNCVRPTNPPAGSTLYYECTKAGNSGSAQPAWPQLPGETRDDGTTKWICRDVAGTASFANLAFRYADPAKFAQPLGGTVFVRLARFIRLWKKLGWKIEQTDDAICAFYRADLAPPTGGDIDTVAELDTGFRLLLPRIGVVVRVMRALNLNLKRDLLPLLACWSNIGTHGSGALYRKMFLTPTLLEQDPVFADNGYGEFLTDASLLLAPHAEALRSAFNLSGDEYALITADLGFDDATRLTIANLSAIFRRGWLARKLKFSVRELLLLIRLTGLNPFAAPDPTNPAILRLIRLVQGMKARALKSPAALYLFWNQDLSGKSTPNPDAIAAFVRSLRSAFSAVEKDFAIADDPDGTIAQTRMATIYGNDATSFFFGLLNDTLSVEVPFSDPDATLDSDVLRTAIETAAGYTGADTPKIAYDDFRKRLAYAGVLTEAARDAIKLAAGAGAAVFNAAVDALYARNQSEIVPFFERYGELRPGFDAYVGDMASPIAVKRRELIKSLLPELKARKKRQQALQTLAAIAGTDLAFTQTFVAPPAGLMPFHASNRANQPAVEDLLGVESAGLSVRFFASDTAGGPVLGTPSIASNLDYAPAAEGSENSLPANPTPGAAISGIWSGRLETPDNGFFNFHIAADADATVTLILNGAPVALLENNDVWSNADAIELQAGVLNTIELTVEKVTDRLSVQWEWAPKGQGRTVIPSQCLYPETTFAAFQATYVRFLKIASLAAGLRLTAGELNFLATRTDYEVGGEGWLNALAVEGAPDAATAIALLTPLEALLDFARIKSEISPDDESLLTILNNPAAATASVDGLLLTLTRWDTTSLTDVLARFGAGIAGLGNFGMFCRVYDALTLAQLMGLSAQALLSATTNNPTGDTVRDLQAALRSRYDAADWRDVVRPINDEMRSLQRDALVACVLHQMRSHPESAHINTPEKLFEYFLMDVQMEPVMQTSRIRHALSSVQLFIERTLMNLEKRVSPAAINAKQWAWMKRYRVWEANRKVYLFPENWLEPELRDDKSPFFKEIESELLQSDITDDSAAAALLTYLSKLEEVAKLEVCGIFHIPADPARRTGEIDHVVARTAGASRKYYYRRREYGYWTAWEQIKVEIEDNPIIPVVWNDRLFVFWVRLLQATKAAPPPSGDTYLDAINASAPSKPKITVQAMLCWSEFYNGKWQPAKTSDVTRPTLIGNFVLGDFSRSPLKLRSHEDGPTLRIFIHHPQVAASYFNFYNTHSLPLRDEDDPAPAPVLGNPTFGRRFSGTSDPLEITYWQSIMGTEFGTKRQLLNSPKRLQSIVPMQDLAQPWDAPFFLEDSHHVFYVRTVREPVWIPDRQDFGSTGNGSTGSEIPPLVLTPDPRLEVGPQFWGDGDPVDGFIDSAPIERFLTEDAYINRGFGATGFVPFGNKQIGPAGAEIENQIGQ